MSRFRSVVLLLLLPASTGLAQVPALKGGLGTRSPEGLCGTHGLASCLAGLEPWPGTTPQKEWTLQLPDSTRVTASQRITVWAAAAVGSGIGVIVGARAARGWCGQLYTCSVEDAGLEQALLGAFIGSTFGAALGATAGGSFAGTRISFGRALSGAGPGAFAGIVMALAILRFVDANDAPLWLVGYSLTQGGIAAIAGLPNRR